MHPRADETRIDVERGIGEESQRAEGERERERNIWRNKREEGERDNLVSGQRRRSETTNDRDERDETAHGGKSRNEAPRKRRR